MFLRLLFLLFLAATCFAGCTSPCSNKDTIIHGTVTDAHTGAPMPGVHMKITAFKGRKHDSVDRIPVENSAVVTDANGQYHATLTTRCPDLASMHFFASPAHYWPNAFASIAPIDFGADNTVDWKFYPRDAAAEFHLVNTGAASARINAYLGGDYLDHDDWIADEELAAGDSIVFVYPVSGGEQSEVSWRLTGQTQSHSKLFSVPIGDTSVVRVAF